MTYRRDIDGLRAIAIVCVIMFHYRIPGTQGGFLGVDVFFVISGFLITKIINSDLNVGKFSIGRFYERRARRIFPALFVVIAVLVISGPFILLPVEFASLGKAIVATTLFMSNLYFFNNDSYFGFASQHEPLLHTWSLAVEEQFYLVFPIALILMRRRGTRFTSSALWSAALASLAVDFVLLQSHRETAAFYWPIPRAWELLCGSLLSLRPVSIIARRWVREIMGATGFALIVLSIVFCPSGGESIIPLALCPCLGASLLILAGSHDGFLASRAIQHRVPVFIGRISYSLYLWHWPILVIYGLAIRGTNVFADRVIPIALTFVIAAFSARFVERPFRSVPVNKGEQSCPALRIAAVTMAASLGIGLVLTLSNGLEARFPADVTKLASYIQYGAPKGFRSGTCFLEPNGPLDFQNFAVDKCLARDGRRRNFLLLGDSHAAHLWVGLSEVYPEINFMQATVASCTPLLNIPRIPASPVTKTCRDMMRFIFREYLPQHRLDGLIISARWPEGESDAFEETIKYTRVYEPNVFVVGRIVEYTEPLPRLLALEKLRQEPDLVRRGRLSLFAALDDKMMKLTEVAGAHYISMYHSLCHAGDCQTITGAGVPLQFDYAHLTAAGSRQVAQEWRTAGEFERVNAKLPPYRKD